MNVAEEVKAIMRKKPYYQHLPYLYTEARKADTILEIGIREGYSTHTFLYGIRDGKQGHLWSIDWGKDPITLRTVEEIKSGPLSKHFTWIKRDFYEMPDLWFEEHTMDLVFLDISPYNSVEPILKCLKAMHKGSKLILLNTKRYPVRGKFLRDLDKSKYHYELLPVLKETAIITKDVDD